MLVESEPLGEEERYSLTVYLRGCVFPKCAQRETVEKETEIAGGCPFYSGPVTHII